MWKSCRRTEDGQKELDQTKEKVQSQKNHPIIAEKENKNEACLTFHCENEKGTTCDRQKWIEELERYSGCKYQDERMRDKARKDLEECAEKV